MRFPEEPKVRAGNILAGVVITQSTGATAPARSEFSSGRKNTGTCGYGTDAVRTLVAWGFSTLNLNRVFLRVYADNPRGIRCYEKVGFQLEGRLRQDNFHDGAYRDTLVMAVLREKSVTISSLMLDLWPIGLVS